MASEKLLTAGYYLDIAIKGGIGLLLAVGGYHFKDMTEKVDGLERDSSKKTAEIAVLQNVNLAYGKQLDRIESAVIKQGDKVDKIWEIAREVRK